MSVSPAIWPVAVERGGDQQRHRFRRGAGQVVVTSMVGKSTSGRAETGSLEVAEQPAQQHRDGQQRGGDRPRDEGGGDAAEAGGARGSAPGGRRRRQPPGSRTSIRGLARAHPPFAGRRAGAGRLPPMVTTAAPWLSRSAPEVTTCSPGSIPWRTTASVAVSAPSRSGRCSPSRSDFSDEGEGAFGPRCTRPAAPSSRRQRGRPRAGR